MSVMDEMINKYEYISESISAVTPIDAVVIAAMITGAVAILGSLINTGMSLRIQSKEHRHSNAREVRQERREMREKMLDPYGKLVSLIFEISALSKQGKSMGNEDLLKVVAKLNVAMILHASNKIISKWGSVRKNALQPNPNFMLELEELLLEIRPANLPRVVKP